MEITIFHLYNLSSMFLFTACAAFLRGIIKTYKLTMWLKQHDGKVYVCLTCHKSIMKKRTSCQVRCRSFTKATAKFKET